MQSTVLATVSVCALALSCTNGNSIDVNVAGETFAVRESFFSAAADGGLRLFLSREAGACDRLRTGEGLRSAQIIELDLARIAIDGGAPLEVDTGSYTLGSGFDEAPNGCLADGHCLVSGSFRTTDATCATFAEVPLESGSVTLTSLTAALSKGRVIMNFGVLGSTEYHSSGDFSASACNVPPAAQAGACF
jgi:hypothetical protein